MSDDVIEEEPPTSGPYCRHWREPGECDEKCARLECGHLCGVHGDSGCDACACEEWVEPPES